MISHTNSLIQSLFIKQEHNASLSKTEQLNLHRGYGIEGDINADHLSPRQVLVVSAEDLTGLSIPPGELRENIVLESTNLAAFKPGAKITFPSGAAIRLTFYCEPCKRVAHLVDSLNYNFTRQNMIVFCLLFCLNCVE